jgi:hypothetical protein
MVVMVGVTLEAVQPNPMFVELIGPLGDRKEYPAAPVACMENVAPVQIEPPITLMVGVVITV